MPELLNLNQFAKLCGAKVQSVMYQVKQGKIKSVTVTKKTVMVPKTEVENFKKLLSKSRHYKMWQKKTSLLK